MSGPAIRDATGRFPKGVSGNPNGRPKVAISARRIAQEKTEEAFLKLVDLMENAKSEELQYRSALSLIEYGIGKAVQMTMDLTPQDGESDGAGVAKQIRDAMMAALAGEKTEQGTLN